MLLSPGGEMANGSQGNHDTIIKVISIQIMGECSDGHVHITALVVPCSIILINYTHG